MLLSDFNQTWNLSKDFREVLEYQVPRKFVQWEPSSFMRTDRQTDRERDRQTWAHFFLRCTLKQMKVEPRNSAAVSLSLWPPVLDLLSGADTKFPQSQLKNSSHASYDTFSLLACVTCLRFSSRPGIIRHCFQRNVAKFAKFLVVRRSYCRSAGWIEWWGRPNSRL